MKPIETVSVIGLGAIGSSFLAKLSETLPVEQLRVIASGQRAERYRKSGVEVNGKPYHFTVLEPEQEAIPADLLLVAVKFGHLQQALQDIRRHVGPDTVILSLINGISSEKIIADAYGADKVLYSLSVGIDATRTGSSTVVANLGRIPFGEAHNSPDNLSVRVSRIRDFFERTGIAYEIPQDMLRTLWWKFMLNVGVNQVSAVLRAPYGAFRFDGGPRALMVEAFREVVAVARKEGIQLHESDIPGVVELLASLSPTGKTSMLQDVEAGRPTEVDIFSGEVIRLGERHGVEVPVNRMLNRLLLAYEDMVVHRALMIREPKT